MNNLIDHIWFEGMKNIMEVMQSSQDVMTRKASAFLMTEILSTAKG